VAGVRAFQAADYNKAIGEFRQALAAAPSASVALYLGTAYLKLGRLGPARDALNEALKIEPGTPKRAAILALIKSIGERTVGRVNVITEPPGATVFVDSRAGGAKGTTPAEIALPPGRHQVIVELEGYEPEASDQVFKGNVKGTLKLTLRPSGCELSLSATPAAARVSVDGGDPAALPTKVRVKEGAHKLTFTADKHDTRELTAVCDGKTAKTLSAELVQTGDLVVPTQPAEHSSQFSLLFQGFEGESHWRDVLESAS
jgi:outer membrane receptor for ferrienterochelin and colicins